MKNGSVSLVFREESFDFNRKNESVNGKKKLLGIKSEWKTNITKEEKNNMKQDKTGRDVEGKNMPVIGKKNEC